nr:UDP-Gal or UDP-GlcNAc-dependent glycosyltransferase [Ipomoea batatas]
MVDAREHLSNTRGVGDHANSPLHLGEITSWNDSWWLVIDSALESSWAPIHKLDGTLGLDGSHSSVHVLGHHITTEHQAACHVFAVARVALDHHR